MTDQESAAVPEGKKNPDAKAGSGSSKKELLQIKLKRILGYVMLGLAPTVAVIALVVAVLAMMGNQSGREQIGKDAAVIAGLNANLSASKLELEKLKVTLATMQKDMALQSEKSKKQDELVAKIVQNITPLQMKLKISPTLEAQLLQAASGVASAVSAAPRVATPPAHETKTPMHEHEAKSAKPAKPKPASVPPDAAPASSAADTPKGEKPPLSPQVKAMKEAIEKFNQK